MLGHQRLDQLVVPLVRHVVQRCPPGLCFAEEKVTRFENEI